MEHHYPEIQSTRNPLVLRFKSLQRAKGRREEGLFLSAGRKVVTEALAAGLKPVAVFCSPRALQPAAAERDLLPRLRRESVYLVNDAVLAAATDTVSPQPLVAAFPLPQPPALAEQQGFCLALDCLQDPGNMGSILRSGDALGADWLLLGLGCAAPYAPKTLRSAMGPTFHLPLVQVENLPAAMQNMAEGDDHFLCGDLLGEGPVPLALPTH